MTLQAKLGILTTDRDLIVVSWDEWLSAKTGISADQARGKFLFAKFMKIIVRRSG